jgi:hypothetical protein
MRANARNPGESHFSPRDDTPLHPPSNSPVVDDGVVDHART